MTTLQTKMTKDEAISIVELAVTNDVLSEIECAWKDHFYSILENATPEQVEAIQLLTGKSDLLDIKSFDLNFSVEVKATFLDEV